MPVEVTPVKTISWPKVILTVVIITLVAGLISGCLYWYYYIHQPEASTSVTINKSATSSAKKATSSAQKDETAGWQTYIGDKEGFQYQFKYPRDWKYNFIPVKETEVVSGGGPELTSPNYQQDFVSGVSVTTGRVSELPAGKSLFQFAVQNDSSLFKEITLGANQVVLEEGTHEEEMLLTYFVSDGKKSF